MNINKDLHDNIKVVQAIIPVAIGANATITGPVLDRRGYGSCEFTFAYGSVTTTGSIVTVVAKEGDVTGTMTSIADADLLGTEALASLLAGARVAGTGKEVSKRLGYTGQKRYVQLLMVKSGVTSVGAVSASLILSSPALMPVANP